MADISIKKQNALTADDFRRLFHYDPETGVFTRLYSRQGCIQGAPVGSFDKRGYLRICLDGFTYTAHRLAWLYVHGIWPSNYIDHINGDKRDNRLCNLREASFKVNSQNKRSGMGGRKYGTLLGAQWVANKKKWRAVISVDGKNRYIGIFSTERAAHEAYVVAKRELHEGCTL